MISAIVLATGDPETSTMARETAVRSLAWLVSAVVAGVVRDVVAACPPSWPVADVMEHVGCELVVAGDEPERLAAAAALVKSERVLVLRLGFQPEGPLVAEIDAAERRLDPSAAALLLAAPSRLFERLFPDRAPIVGIMVSRSRLLDGSTTFRQLVRGARGGERLRTRLLPAT